MYIYACIYIYIYIYVYIHIYNSFTPLFVVCLFCRQNCVRLCGATYPLQPARIVNNTHTPTFL